MTTLKAKVRIRTSFKVDKVQASDRQQVLGLPPSLNKALVTLKLLSKCTVTTSEMGYPLGPTAGQDGMGSQESAAG